MRRGFTRTYRAVITLVSPLIRGWGRLEVSGLESMPQDGPVLLAGNHDSYWDPVTVGVAALNRRQVHALAKSSLWKPGLGRVLDGMAQIPIERGKADASALDAAISKLREGACIGIFLEGTRSLGRELRARSGFGRLALAVPEAQIVCVTVSGTTQISAFPRRPRLRVHFFRPAEGGLKAGESSAELGARLLSEIRSGAPVAAPARRFAKA